MPQTVLSSWGSLAEMVNENNLNNTTATAFEETDAPPAMVVVKNERNPCGNKVQKLKFAAWIVRTTNYSDNSNRPERMTAIISKELAKARISALSEVTREGTGNIFEKVFTIYWSGGLKKEAGVGFAVSNKLANSAIIPLPISDRLMMLRVELQSGAFLKLISVYRPTMQHSQEEKEHFYESLTQKP